MAKPSYNDDTLLARWLSGELSPEEEAALRRRPEFKDYERLLAGVDRMQPPAYDTDAAFAALRRARTAPVTKTLHPRPRPYYQRPRLWYGAAAAIALLLTAWFLLRNGAENYATGTGEQLMAKNLSDGSSIRLNDQTVFDFAPSDTTRLAKLTGEAFFEVEKSTVPFVVETELGNFTVVGTAFNVYSRGDSMSVRCTEGQVKVTFANAPEAYPLLPGDGVSINAAGQISTEIGDEAESLDWLSNRSVFVNRPLQEILDELERQYDIVIRRPVTMDVRKQYTLEFPHDELTLALDNVLTPANMDYEIAGNEVIPRPKN